MKTSQKQKKNLVEIDPNLDKFKDKVLFPQKVALAKRKLSKVKAQLPM